MPTSFIRLGIRHLRCARIHSHRCPHILVGFSLHDRRLFCRVRRELGSLDERDFICWSDGRDGLFFRDRFGVVKYVLDRFRCFLLQCQL